jgi:hypothetical protein
MSEIDPHVVSTDFETSTDIAEFAKAFPKAQAAMGDVLKKATNPAFRSKYADLAAVVEAVIPALNESGFSVLQPPATTRDGTVRIMTMILHESGQWMRCTLALKPTKADPQGVGSAITYGRRYGLQAMTGVAPEDDDGNAASRPNGQPVAANGSRITREQADELCLILEDAGADVARFCAFMRVERLSDLPANRFDAAKTAAEAKLKQKEAA